MVWKFTKDEVAQGHQDTSNLHALNEFKGQGSKNDFQRTGKPDTSICNVPNTNKYQTKGLITHVTRHFTSAHKGQGYLLILKMASTKDEQLSSLDTSGSALSAFTKGNVIFRNV